MTAANTTPLEPTSSKITANSSKAHRASRAAKQSIMANGRAKTNVGRHHNHYHPNNSSQQQAQVCAVQQHTQQPAPQPLGKHYHIPLDTYQPLQPLHLTNLRFAPGPCCHPAGPSAPSSSTAAGPARPKPQTLSLALPPCNGSYLSQLSAASLSTKSSHHHQHHVLPHQPATRIATISSPMSPTSCCSQRPTELQPTTPNSDATTPTLVKVKTWYTVTKQGLSY
ncbi:uncharacterized protein LOC131209474 [Anopheles bellator]|uniref:uncharacterized protein LOC131209474 n=1 Tax=Anopheles bellator TaxID=139047 RepID=UPI002649A80B|nr:uncharacterized protein LOC131209474 [Anopheles bellator]